MRTRRHPVDRLMEQLRIKVMWVPCEGKTDSVEGMLFATVLFEADKY